VFDGAYQATALVRPLVDEGVVVVTRLRRDPKLFGAPPLQRVKAGVPLNMAGFESLISRLRNVFACSTGLGASIYKSHIPTDAYSNVERFMESLIKRNLHQLPAEEVLQLLAADPERGLDLLELQDRQARFGANFIPAAKGNEAWKRFLLQFHTPLVYILLAAALITAVLQEWVDSSVIFGVVLVNAIIGFIQESSAAKALAALARTTLTEASVLRAGEVKRISSVDLVPGDIVLLQSGDKVPADLRLFRCRDLQVDESALTGESVPVKKQVAELAGDVTLAERSNLAFTSTLVTYGQGRGVVFATGSNTEVGHISKLISTADALETPLTRKIAKFSRLLLVVILGLAGLTFVAGWLRGQPAMEMLMAAVALAVGAIPEGLPAAVTITLSIGVARMARRRAIVRKLPAVETLGSTTVVCSDKTGTLTVNQMTVSEIMAGNAFYELTGNGYDPAGEINVKPNEGSAFGSKHRCAGVLTGRTAVQRFRLGRKSRPMGSPGRSDGRGSADICGKRGVGPKRVDDAIEENRHDPFRKPTPIHGNAPCQRHGAGTQNVRQRCGRSLAQQIR
jgi:magnesium-transporting ATPase (P-type)